jgi:hypothetical protein
MEQLARLGIMSTSTELYSLALALLTGEREYKFVADILVLLYVK